MSNPLSATKAAAPVATPAASPSSPVSGTVQGKDEYTLSPAARAKAELNMSIVQASLTVSLNTSNDPLSLVLKTALTGINEALKGDYGDNAIQNAASQDNTPDGTAGRIVSLSTAFYEAYRQQHPGEDESTLLNKFMDTLKSGVDQGFKEARGVLDGLKVLNGDIASNIDKTYDLVQQGYADFASAQQARIDDAGKAAATGKASASAA